MWSKVLSWAKHQVEQEAPAGSRMLKRRASDTGAKEKAAVQESLVEYNLGLQHGARLAAKKGVKGAPCKKKKKKQA